MKRAAGWTLLELLCVLMIVAIGATGARYFSQETVNKNTAQIVKEQLLSGVAFSRNTALVRGRPVALNPLQGDWSHGMVLFVDNKTHLRRPEDAILHVWQWNPGPFTVQWHGFQSARFLVFVPEGMHAASNGHFSLEYQGKEQVRLVVNRLGRIHMS